MLELIAVLQKETTLKRKFAKLGSLDFYGQSCVTVIAPHIYYRRGLGLKGNKCDQLVR